jgi:hypothetical protein
MKAIATITVLFLTINSFSQVQKHQIDSFNLDLRSKYITQIRNGKAIMGVGVGLGIGTILYWTLLKPEAPAIDPTWTIAKTEAALSSFNREFDSYKTKRTIFAISSGILFLSGSILRGAGLVHKQIYKSRKYSAQICFDDIGMGLCFNFR